MCYHSEMCVLYVIVCIAWFTLHSVISTSCNEHRIGNVAFSLFVEYKLVLMYIYIYVCVCVFLCTFVMCQEFVLHALIACTSVHHAIFE